MTWIRRVPADSASSSVGREAKRSWAIVAGLPAATGATVIVAFEGGDSTRPVVLGALPGAGDVWTLPGGSTLRLDRQSGDLAVEHASGASVTMTTAGCTVRSPATVTIEASAVEVHASMTKLVSPMVEVSGVVKSDTVITNNVIASSYTPGAGNVW